MHHPLIPDIFKEYGPYLKPKEVYYYLFGEICSIYTYHDLLFDDKIIEKLKSNYGGNEHFKLLIDHDTYADKKRKDEANYVIVLNKNLLVWYAHKHIAIYYDSENPEALEEVKKIVSPFEVKEEKKPHFFMAMADSSCEYGMDLKKCEVTQVSIDLVTHYNADFFPVHQRILSFLNEEKSGLIILHGKQGTGKTTYIRHLINNIDKRIIYLPAEMSNSLTQPSFLPFLANFPDSILVLEDCEELLKARNSSTALNSGLVNILNMSDGLIGDGFKLKFICTFNAPLKEIDQALLRKGRLVARYEFGVLEPEKVNQLIKKENLNIPSAKTPMTLADIYYHAEKDFEPAKSKSIGFQN